MVPKEMRIGNWFHHAAKWSIRQPKGAGSAFPLQEFDFQWDETDWYALGECTLSLNVVEPIPLTEEWLLRFGFSCVDEVNRGFTKTINTPLKEKFYCSPVDGVCALISELTSYKDFILSIRVNQIHQLQNLFFALTGQELTPTK